MLNLTLSSLYVAKQSISPLFTSKIAYNIKKSSFNFQISPIFVRFSPISISNTQFKKFTSSVIRISSDETVYSDIYTKRIVILNPQNSINITSSVFVSIRSDEEGGGLKIYRGPNESPYLITMKQTKFYNCTSQSSAGAFAITDCPIEMSKVCITHSTAKEHSGFIVSTDSLICNSSFIRQCHSKDSSEGSVKIDADDLLFSNFNFTLPNDNAITNEKAIDTSFLSSDISYVSVDQWFSPIIFKFSIQKSSEESSIIQNINFNNVSASTALVELSIASTTAKLEINNFTRKDTSFETAFISNDLIQPILVSNSMFDKEDVNVANLPADESNSINEENTSENSNVSPTNTDLGDPIIISSSTTEDEDDVQIISDQKSSPSEEPTTETQEQTNSSEVEQNDISQIQLLQAIREKKISETDMMNMIDSNAIQPQCLLQIAREGLINSNKLNKLIREDKVSPEIIYQLIAEFQIPPSIINNAFRFLINNKNVPTNIIIDLLQKYGVNHPNLSEMIHTQQGQDFKGSFVFSKEVIQQMRYDGRPISELIIQAENHTPHHQDVQEEPLVKEKDRNTNQSPHNDQTDYIIYRKHPTQQINKMINNPDRHIQYLIHHHGKVECRGTKGGRIFRIAYFPTAFTCIYWLQLTVFLYRSHPDAFPLRSGSNSLVRSFYRTIPKTIQRHFHI